MIRELVLATRNRNKVKEIREILKGLNLNILTVDDFPGCPEVVEDGATFEENAVKKARAVSGFTGKAALSDDSGLEVDALNGEPGIYSARYAGEGCSYDDNNNKLLGMMKDIPVEQSQARFVCVAVLFRPDGGVMTARGVCEGVLGKEKRGSNGFGYDPIFIVPEYGKTFAELDSELKNRISHRAKAFNKIKESIK